MPIKAGEAAKEPILCHLISLRDRRQPIEGLLDFGESERAKLASFLKLESLSDFSFQYRLEPVSGERFHLTGLLSARLTQACVVTLEPVAEQVEEAVDLECWPRDQIKDQVEEEQAIGPEELPNDPPVPILGNQIDLGALAAEILASTINPYPRKEGVAFDWEDPKPVDEGKAEGPFAELGKLKSEKRS
jgi:hypothetical protein